ncbi:MAG: DUF1565 domain-containing protein [Fibrobacterales bacterium]
MVYFLITSIVGLFLLNACTSEPDAIINSGTMTQTDNTISGQVTYPDGLYAPNVEVTLRSSRYTPDFDSGSTNALLKIAATETPLDDSITVCDIICRDTTDENGSYSLFQPDTTFTLEFKELFPKDSIGYSHFVDSLSPVLRDLHRTDMVEESERLVIPVPGNGVETLVWVLGTGYFGTQIGGDTLSFGQIPKAQYVILFFVNGSAVGESNVPTIPYPLELPEDLPSSSSVEENSLSSEEINVSSSIDEIQVSSSSEAESGGGSSSGNGGNGSGGLLSSNDAVVIPVLTQLHVSQTGSDELGNGTSGNPFRQIQKALSVVDTMPLIEEIRVALGSYSNAGQGDSTIRIRNGVHLLGGFDNSFNQRDLSFSVYRSVIDKYQGAVSTDTCGHPLMTAEDITNYTIVEGFVLENNKVCVYDDDSFDKHGAGIHIVNSSDSLYIVSNYLKYNGIQRHHTNPGTVWIKGGNIASYNSAPKVLGNYIGSGYSLSVMDGMVWSIYGDYNGVKAEFAYNEGDAIQGRDDHANSLVYNNVVGRAGYMWVSPLGSDDVLSSSGSFPWETLDKAAENHLNQFVFVAVGDYTVESLEGIKASGFWGGYSTDFKYRYRYPLLSGDYDVIDGGGVRINTADPSQLTNCTYSWVIDSNNVNDISVSTGVSFIGGKICQ